MFPMMVLELGLILSPARTSSWIKRRLQDAATARVILLVIPKTLMAWAESEKC